MKVNNYSTPTEVIRRCLRDRNGIIYSADLDKLGIPREYIRVLVKRGELQRTSRGVYSTPEAWGDEMAELQVHYKSAIYSHETALYLLGLTDRTPISFSVTVPSGYNASALKRHQIKVYFIQPALISSGVILQKSPAGNEIRTYNIERTICDIIRNRNRMDIQLVNGALKAYINRKDKNILLLTECAEKLGIQKKVREYIEVLL